MTPDQQIKADAMDFWINELHCVNWPVVLSAKDLDSLQHSRDALLKMARYCDEIINKTQVQRP